MIPDYAAHVARVMEAMEPARPGNGSVIAIGEVHRIKNNVKAGDLHFPATVSHYWDGYRPENASKAATLVLEIHNHKHSLKSLILWLLEDASGPRDVRGKPVGPQQSKRLRLYYVAFTRSTHIICLALPKTALGEASERDHRIARLTARGWSTKEIV